MFRTATELRKQIHKALDYYESLSDCSKARLPHDTDPKWFDAVMEKMNSQAIINDLTLVEQETRLAKWTPEEIEFSEERCMTRLRSLGWTGSRLP